MICTDCGIECAEGTSHVCRSAPREREWSIARPPLDSVTADLLLVRAEKEWGVKVNVAEETVMWPDCFMAVSPSGALEIIENRNNASECRPGRMLMLFAPGTWKSASIVLMSEAPK